MSRTFVFNNRPLTMKIVELKTLYDNISPAVPNLSAGVWYDSEPDGEGRLMESLMFFTVVNSERVQIRLKFKRVTQSGYGLVGMNLFPHEVITWDVFIHDARTGRVVESKGLEFFRDPGMMLRQAIEFILD